jgi:hypothetical protein
MISHTASHVPSGLCYCHVYHWLNTKFELVIGFIGYLRAVTTNNFNTVTDFHSTEHSTLLTSVYLQ